MKSKIKTVCWVLLLLLCLQTAAPVLQAVAEDTREDAPHVVLTLDDGYSEVLDAGVQRYAAVYLPAGRPRIPRVIAGCEEHVVRSSKPYFADGDTVAYATYEYDCLPEEIGFVFIKTEELGFELQYDDRYTFVPASLRGDVTFSSDNLAVASVNAQGVITAKQCSDTPVTVTATGASGTETLVITRIVPAQIDIVMSVGQSNAYGKGGKAADAPKVRPGTAYDILYDGDTQAANATSRPMPLADTEGTGTAVSGIRQAFANEWYETVGEKILFINAADPGIKIAEWLPTGKVYKGAKKEYDRVKKLIEDSENFEVYREFFYFNHGSADAGGNFNAAYYQNVNTVFRTLFEQTDMEFGTIFEYFSSDRDYTTWIRANHNRIAAEDPRIYMGCEMKPYIQADPTLLNSDNLHLTQKGHNLCGTLLAKNTVSQALRPAVKENYSTPDRLDAPTYAYEFNRSAEAAAGGNRLQVLTSAPTYTADGTAAVFNGAAALKFTDRIRLRADADFCIEFRMKLTGSAKQFAVLGSGDNAGQVYINLSDGKTQGFKVRYGAEGVQGTAITLSVRNTQDFYEYNTWRLYYVAELSLLYLYRDNELQSTEILPGMISVDQIGKTGTVNQSGCTAELDFLHIRTADAGGSYRFAFENSLREENAAVTLTESGPGRYENESVLLQYSSNDYSFDQLTLDKSKDWRVEVRGQFSKNTAIVASADGSQTIFANTSDPGFRVRSTSSSYIKLAVGAGDFSSVHTWRIAYSAASHTVTLYKDGAKVSSGTVNATLKFTHSGTSGTTGTTNSALVDYITLQQAGIHKNGADTVTFDFNRSLTDSSGAYTMKLLKGSTAYQSGDTGYVLAPGSELTFGRSIPLPQQSFVLRIKAKFDGAGTVIPGVLNVTRNALVFGGQEFPVDEALLGAANVWTFTGTDGKVTLTLPDGKATAGKTVSDSLTVAGLGGAGTVLYALEIQAEKTAAPAPFTVEISEENGLHPVVSSAVYDLSKTSPNVLWCKNGHAVPAGDFSRLDVRVGDVISCKVTYNGLPFAAEAAYEAKTERPAERYGAVPPVPPVTTDTPAVTDAPAVTEAETPEKSGCGAASAFPLLTFVLVSLVPLCRKGRKERKE